MLTLHVGMARYTAGKALWLEGGGLRRLARGSFSLAVGTLFVSR